MVDSYRLTVLKRLTAHLQNINPSNGFDFDLGCAVYRGRVVFSESDQLPMLSIIEGAQPPQGTDVGMMHNTRQLEWPLIIQGWCENDPANPSDNAYSLMAAVEYQLGRLIAMSGPNVKYPDEYMLGPGLKPGSRLIADLRYGPGVVRPPNTAVSSEAFFFMPVWVKLVETPGQPYFGAPVQEV